MRPERNLAGAIAARIEDIDTDTGQIRGLQPGFILCERSPQRMGMRPHSSRFVVRPWEKDQIRLIMKGFNPLVSGDAGTDMDGRPLFLKAAERYPERREEFLAEVQRIDDQRAKSAAERKKLPPTAAEQAMAQAAVMAEGFRQGAREAMADMVEAGRRQVTGPEPEESSDKPEPRATKAR